VVAAALVGPAQVAARIVEFGLMRRTHPLISARIAAVLHPIGAALLGALGPFGVMVFALLHGAGNGMITIAKGTLPLAIFGPHGFGLRSGVLSVTGPDHPIDSALPLRPTARSNRSRRGDAVRRIDAGRLCLAVPVAGA